MVDATGVPSARPNEDVKVLRSPRVSVERDCMSSDNNEICTGVVKLYQNVAEICGQFDHVSGPRTKQYGVDARS